MVWTVIIKDQSSRIYSKNSYSSPDYTVAFLDLQNRVDSSETVLAIIKGSHEIYSKSDYIVENNLS